MNQQVLVYPNLDPGIFFGYLPTFPQTNIPTLTAPINIPNHDSAISYTTSQYYGASYYYPTLNAGIAAAPIFCGSSQMVSHGPPSQLPPPSNHGVSASVEHQGNDQLMETASGAHKIKIAEGIMGNSDFLNTQSAPSPFVAAGHLPLPELGSQQNVRYRLDMSPVLVPGQNHLVPGTYLVQPSLPSGCVRFNQQLNNGRLDGAVSPWCQPPPIPYMHEPGNLSSQRHCHETFMNRDSSVFPGPFGINPSYHSFIHYPPHLPISLSTSLYPHISLHHQEHSSMEAPIGHLNLPPLRLVPADEVALLEVGDFSEVESHSDRHEGMRLDIEHMSYEELLALSEGIGHVNTGLSQETVMKRLKTRTYLSSEMNLDVTPTPDQETNTCIICQENYKSREKIGTLDCGHEYHADCLKKWLSVKNVCPICKFVALAPKKEHE